MCRFGLRHCSRPHLSDYPPSTLRPATPNKPRAGTGHNFQLMDYTRRKVANIETAAGQLYAFREITEPYFHANQYTTLNVAQHFNNSSKHRVARVAQLPVPYDAPAVLNVLGDQDDVQYPLFHDVLSHARGELSDWTLATVMFDLDNRTMTMYHGNPKNGVAMYLRQLV